MTDSVLYWYHFRLDIWLKPGSLDYTGIHVYKNVVLGEKQVAVFVHKTELQTTVVWIATASLNVKKIICKLKRKYIVMQIT